MVRTSFLPSDDSVRFPYHIPGNAFACVELNRTASMLEKLLATPSASNIRSDPDRALASTLVIELKSLSKQIDEGIQRHGIVSHRLSGKEVYAMEVDGYGNYFFADDANVPSLLALPFIGYVSSTDPTYLNTRSLVLSNESNPYFYGSNVIAPHVLLGGVGSEDASGNAGLGHVWPLSLAIRLMTIPSIMNPVSEGCLYRILIYPFSHRFFHHVT